MKVSNFHANHVFDCYLSYQLLYSLNLALIKLRWNIKEEKKKVGKRVANLKLEPNFITHCLTVSHPFSSCYSDTFVCVGMDVGVSCWQISPRLLIFVVHIWLSCSKKTKLNNNDKFQSIIVNHTCCKNNFKNSIVLSLEFVF